MVAYRYELQHNEVPVGTIVDGCLEVGEACNEAAIAGYALHAMQRRRLQISAYLVGSPDISSATAAHLIKVAELLDKHKGKNCSECETL